MIVVASIKKKVWNLGAIIFFIWFAFKAIGYGMDLLNVELPSICSHTDVAEFPSPNGKKIARLSYADCGATTNWQASIDIVDVETGKAFNSFFGLDGKPDDLEVVWESDIKLTFANFPIENLLWFNQDYKSGVAVSIKSSMAKSLKQEK